MDIVESLRKYQCPENKGCNPVVEYCQCALMDNSADEIERLREALQKCGANFVTKSSDHRIAAQEILDEFERRALIARAATEGIK